MARQPHIDIGQSAHASIRSLIYITEDDHGVLWVIGPTLRLDDAPHRLRPKQVVVFHETAGLQEGNATEDGPCHLVTLFLVEIHGHAMHPDEILGANELLMSGGFIKPLMDIIDMATLNWVRKKLLKGTNWAVIENSELQTRRQAVESLGDVAATKRCDVGKLVLDDEISDTFCLDALVVVHALKI